MPAPARRPTSCWRANSSAAGAWRPSRHQNRQLNRSRMSQPPKPRGLGRGLSALLGDEDVAGAVTPAEHTAPEGTPGAASARAPLSLPIGRLRPGRMQPRTTFEDLEALVDSVKEFGLLQPILVRPIAGQVDAYEIVAGERRW